MRARPLNLGSAPEVPLHLADAQWPPPGQIFGYGVGRSQRYAWAEVPLHLLRHCTWTTTLSLALAFDVDLALADVHRAVVHAAHMQSHGAFAGSGCIPSEEQLIALIH